MILHVCFHSSKRSTDREFVKVCLFSKKEKGQRKNIAYRELGNGRWLRRFGEPKVLKGSSKQSAGNSVNAVRFGMDRLDKHALRHVLG